MIFIQLMNVYIIENKVLKNYLLKSSPEKQCKTSYVKTTQITEEFRQYLLTDVYFTFIPTNDYKNYSHTYVPLPEY